MTNRRKRIFSSIREDIGAVLERDPAARSTWEVLLCYPGLHALWAYRTSHWLWQKRFYWLARMLSQLARFATGIEIHPGALIGRRLFIDHGMGVIIGETAVVGDDVTLYQGVTLGGTGKEKGKRHPTIESGVTVGAGAKVLGNIRIGENCRVGAGSVVLRDVPQNSTAVGVPARLVYRDGKRVVIVDPKDISDPVLDLITSLTFQVQDLRRIVASMHSGQESGSQSTAVLPAPAHTHANAKTVYLVAASGHMINLSEEGTHVSAHDGEATVAHEIIQATAF